MKGRIVAGLFLALVVCGVLVYHDMEHVDAPAPVATAQPAPAPPPQEQTQERPRPAPAPVEQAQQAPVQEAPPPPAPVEAPPPPAPPRQFSFSLRGTGIGFTPTTLGSIISWNYQITNNATSIPISDGMYATPLIGGDEVPGTRLDIHSDPGQIPPGASAVVEVRVGVNGLWQQDWTSLPGSQYQSLSCRQMKEKYPLWTGFVVHMDGANLILPLPCP